MTMDSRPQDKSVIDRETSLRRLGGDEHLLAKLAAFFLEDAPEVMRQLGDAHLSGDCKVVAHRAHSLKGLSATFEAITFQKLADEIESLAVAGEDLQINHRIIELKTEYDRLVAQLQLLVHSITSGP